IYFSFLFADNKALNRAEDRLEFALDRIPRGQRVFSSFSIGMERVIVWAHLADRACIGRCFSYDNYEPNSGAFRIRAALNSPVVVGTPAQYDALRNGGYVVRKQDLPLYQIRTCGEGTGSICVSPLEVGETTRT